MIFGILDRYIGRSIFSTTMLVLLTLVALGSIFEFIGELDNVGTGSYTVGRAAQYILLTVPGNIYLLFAPSVLLGSLLGLGALASNSELTVMRAAGISIGRIIRAVLVTGIGLTLLIAFVGETIMPKTQQIAEDLRINSLERQLSATGSSGLWLKSADKYVSIGTVTADLTLLDVSVRQFVDNKITLAFIAAQAVPIGDDWQLNDVAVTWFQDDSTLSERIYSIRWSEFARRISVTTYPDSVKRESTALVSSDVLRSISISPDSLSATDLYEQVKYLKDNELDSRNIELAFWVKLVSPLSSLVMLMLSLPFVFASQRAGGAGQKIFIGIILGIVYVLLNRLLTQLALTNGLPPLASAVLPLACFLIIALIGIARTA